MKINETQRLGAIQYSQKQQAMNRASQKPSRKDELIISTEAQEMLDAQNRVNDPARSDRIADLKKAVSTGTYYVEADKIAEKLLPLFRKENE
ncbi:MULTISPECIES: flagellar biosynthesis anti-sigma factor FlgM [Paenibacillus]|uniref:Negative regulator of flagellin synthesis n=1 Tax=Paenibacillus alvei TaxID=44250 RepID=A0ABT4E4K9_PAEAL|nr:MULTISPECIES: flagellar biosynthesis anti-sigma factor FlgM [Paenibacillus]MCY9528652.1 flagellar biosynthesis anti-sigma factor FlgM [Paenibacillus alvei]SDG23803.1 anti-sigma-28 factor, FlgM family [Paenibacillus sp. cl6col]